jgi:hypothetical protein
MSACDARRKCRRLRPMLTRRAWAASGGRQAPAASCRDCSAAWLPQEQIPVSWCRDCSAVAAPPLSLSNLAKAQTRMLTGMDPGSYGPHSRARDGGYLPALLVGMNGASLHNRIAHGSTSSADKPSPPKSATGRSRHIALPHELGRLRGKADVAFIASRHRGFGYKA